jgi:tetratricopeptide (TPR) repeat protein
MKLRFPAYFQQLLFAAGSVLLLEAGAFAQQDAEVVMGGVVQRAKVVSISGSALVVRTEAGDRPVQLAQISDVRMAAPPEWAAGLQAYQARDFGKALGLVKSVTDRFRGLPGAGSPWAQQASALLVEIHLALKDSARAEIEYGAFVKAYPSGGLLQAEVIGARIALSKKNVALAKQKLGPITEAALKEKVVHAINGAAYGQAFLASGQIKEAEGNLAGALEDYLRTVTIFHHDRGAVALAQEKADSLRIQHPAITVP